MKKKSIVVLCLILIAAFWLTGSGSGSMIKNSKSSASTDSANQAVVERGDILSRVSCTGTVEPRLEIEIKGKASGEITALHAEVSTRVQKGDLLIELDPSDEERNVRQAEVNLQSSKARLEQAVRGYDRDKATLELDKSSAGEDLATARANLDDTLKQLERYRSLFKSKLVSQESLDKQELAYTKVKADLTKAELKIRELEITDKALAIKEQDIILARGNVESDEITLEQARQRLEDTKVLAPISGVITERQIQEGQIISSPTSNVSGGTSLLVVADDSSLFVEASVDECDIGQIAVGQRVEVTVDAFPEHKFSGKVVLVDAKGAETSNVVTFGVKMELEKAARERLKPGMTANVDIITAEASDVLLIPSEAIITRNGKKFLMLATGSTLSASKSGMNFSAEPPAAKPGPEKLGNSLETGDQRPEPPRDLSATRPRGQRNLVPVVVGIVGDDRTQIVSGVKEGQKILITDSKTSKWSKNSDSKNKSGMPPGPGIMGMMGGGRRSK